MLFEPAIRIARDGFRATPLLESRLKVLLSNHVRLFVLNENVKSAEKWLMTMPEWTEIFAPNGTLAQAGDLVVRANLAKTLEIIALDGPNSFYKVKAATNERAVD